jgi:hypothetical protein
LAADGIFEAMSVALEVRPAPPTTTYRKLFELVDAGARAEGCAGSLHSGVRFHRVSCPATFRRRWRSESR